MSILQDYLERHHILHHKNQGITIVPVNNSEEGIEKAKEFLYTYVSKKTVLYLSGGKTPAQLYSKIAQESVLEPGAVGIVDERFGHIMHETSNEKMFRDTNLIGYLHKKGIPFYPVITKNTVSYQEAAHSYDTVVRELHATYQQSAAIMGIGTDGHTSSIAPNRPGEFENPFFQEANKHMLVAGFNDPKSFYGERVGMTFLGISLLDLLIVLVFGDDKKIALAQLFEDGDEKTIPARIFKRPEIAAKTIIISDQQI